MTFMTPERREAFLRILAQGSSVAAAARTIGMSRGHMYLLRKTDEQFARDWDQAVEEGTDILEDVAVERAKNGSDSLLVFLLKGRRREKWGDKPQSEGKTEIAGMQPAFVMYAPGMRPSVSDEHAAAQAGEDRVPARR